MHKIITRRAGFNCLVIGLIYLLGGQLIAINLFFIFDICLENFRKENLVDYLKFVLIYFWNYIRFKRKKGKRGQYYIFLPKYSFFGPKHLVSYLMFIFKIFCKIELNIFNLIHTPINNFVNLTLKCFTNYQNIYSGDLITDFEIILTVFFFHKLVKKIAKIIIIIFEILSFIKFRIDSWQFTLFFVRYAPWRVYNNIL
ncbi:hypothetical protein BpHYR1_019525 [Brachionus plicatilis]|uniref:Uncharacterized protein n=1 Tax=Brachionus plicatilis TaxID=10195 RepID=A0A3M7PTX3_BRAPC|nr:hypothetical protein BpHYR1_019525 [Brachionus plicatilis]